jgi:hypothetical protein
LAAPFRKGGAARGSAKGGSATFIAGLGGPASAPRAPGGGAEPMAGEAAVLGGAKGGGALGGAADFGVEGFEGGAELIDAGVLLAAGGGGAEGFGASVAPAVLFTHRLSSLS